MFYMHDIGWGWWLVMSVGMVAFWGLVIFGIVWLARNGSSQERAPRPPEPPEAILKRRLAQGEISIEEYEQRLDALQRGRREPMPV